MRTHATNVKQPGPLELVPGQLVALGANYPLSSSVSWAPPGIAALQSSNCYLIRTTDTGWLLIDTGIATIQGQVVEQLGEILPYGSVLSVFLTRGGDWECIGGLRRVLDYYRVSDLYVVGFINAFGTVDWLSDNGMSSSRKSASDIERVRKVFPTALKASGSDGSLEVISSPLKNVSTHWLYDPGSRTLFTSDSFTHTLVGGSVGPSVLTDPTLTPSVAIVRRWLAARFWWVPLSSPGLLRSELSQILESYEVDRIAPAAGAILEGRSVVRSHIDALMAALP